MGKRKSSVNFSDRALRLQISLSSGLVISSAGKAHDAVPDRRPKSFEGFRFE